MAGVQLLEVLEVQILHVPRTIGGAVQRVIVDDDELATPRAVEIELDGIYAGLQRARERRQGVLGRDRRRAEPARGASRFYPTILPCDETTDVEWTIPAIRFDDITPREEMLPPLELEFNDAQGRRWRRLPDGSLRRRRRWPTD